MTQKSHVFVISGCTNSGKTTLAERMANLLGRERTTILHQDDYYYGHEQKKKQRREGMSLQVTVRKPTISSKLSATDHFAVEKLYMTKDGKDVTERGFFYSYDEKESVDIARFQHAIQEAADKFDHVIIEGNMLTEMEGVLELCTKVVVLTLDVKTCKTRRDTRTYDPPDDIGYFEYVAWPAYQRHLKRAFERGRIDNRFSFLDVSEFGGSSIDVAMNCIFDQIMNNHLRITDNVLDIQEVQRIATSSSCGAISTFVGTTRDNFEGKTVKNLSYECYDEMAYKELRKICDQIRLETPSIEKIVMFHRVGDVPVGEASVMIATSSPHRTEAIKATEEAINLLKSTVPIFKKETYTDGESTWKTNKCNGHTPSSNQKPTNCDVNSSEKYRKLLENFVNL